MGFESGTYVSDLTPSWPLDSDLESQGAAHIRLIKATLKNTFTLTGAASGWYLALTGGTLTGNLTVAPSATTAQITLNKSASGQGNNIVGQTAGSIRWVTILGDNVAEGGGNIGSNFDLQRYDNTGTLIDTPLTIARSTGRVQFSQPPVGIPGVTDGSNAAAGQVGELMSTQTGVAVGLANATPATILGLALTAGDWDVWGAVTVAAAPSGLTAIVGAMSLVAATLQQPVVGYSASSATIAASTGFQTSTIRASGSGTINVYLVVEAFFSAGGCNVNGWIFARRRR